VIIGIDAGHGGKNHGARNLDGDLREPGITLHVATIAANKLLLDGIAAPLIRIDDCDLTLDERAGIAKRARCDAVVSVHLNWSPNGTRQGGELYHHPSDRVGERLGVVILSSVPPPYEWRVWDSSYRIDRKIACPGAWAVTSAYANAGVPCALIELAFLSSPHDVDWLRHQDTITVLGEAVAVGIERYRP